jgi:hypothetical protein
VSEYEHIVYGTGSALIREPDGTVRDATPEELERLQDTYKSAIEASFKMRIASEFECRLDLIAAHILTGAPQ